MVTTPIPEPCISPSRLTAGQAATNGAAAPYGAPAGRSPLVHGRGAVCAYERAALAAWRAVRRAAGGDKSNGVYALLTQTYKSPLADAIRESNRAHRRTMAELPTGAPTLTSETRAVPASRADRAPLRVVRVAADSYAGIGTVERNRKRAARRAQQRAKRAQA